MHVYWFDLNCSYVTMHGQSTAVVPETSADIPPQTPTLGADPGDIAVKKDKGLPPLPPVVCVHIVACTSSA